MTMDFWDATASAPSHAALAGLLAGFSLTSLTLTLIPLADESDGGKRGAPNPTTIRRTQSHSAMVRLFILSFAALVVASVLWGGLAGYPRVEGWVGLNTEIELKAASAVIVLALGALTLFAAIGDLLVWVGVPQVRHSFARAFVALVGLAMFQIASFLRSTLGSMFPEWWGSVPTFVQSYSPAGLAIVAAGMTYFATKYSRPLYADRHALRVTRRVGTAAVGFAVLAYAALPSPDPGGDARDKIDIWHYMALSLVALAVLTLVAFVTVLARGMSASTLGVERVRRVEMPNVTGNSSTRASGHEYRSTPEHAEADAVGRSTSRPAESEPNPPSRTEEPLSSGFPVADQGGTVPRLADTEEGGAHKAQGASEASK